jgi:hypothetical protein
MKALVTGFAQIADALPVALGIAGHHAPGASRCAAR